MGACAKSERADGQLAGRRSDLPAPGEAGFERAEAIGLDIGLHIGTEPGEVPPTLQLSLGFIRSLQGLQGEWRAAYINRAPTRCQARCYLTLFNPLRHPGLVFLFYR